ncbi:MAG: leucine-rich repeat protein [Barnesiella sp.]|nr:leucine-rich repeat protein [Barnesiella sp.]
MRQTLTSFLKNIIPSIVACFCLSMILKPHVVYAETITNVTIDGFKYDLDTETKKAKVKKGPNQKNPYHLVIPETTVYDSITYIVTEIAAENNNSFSNLNITGITLPNTIEYIGNDAFYNCTNFKGDLIIPNSVKHIGKRSFNECGGTGKLVLGNGLEYIDQRAFYKSKFTGSLNIPESTTYIDEGAFYLCNGFTGSLIIPDSVSYLGPYAFGALDGISGTLYIGKSVNQIGVSCFSWTCNHVDSIIIYGNNLKIVNSTGNPFHSTGSDCRLIYFSNQVKSIDRDIFATIYYKNLEEVISDNPTPPVFTSSNGQTGVGFYGTVKEKAVLKVPVGSIEAYKSATYWKDFKNIQEFTHEPTEVSLNYSEISLFVNDSVTLSAKTSPFYADNYSLNWESSDETVVEVDENGKITSKSVGEAQITATTNNNLTATCHVSVKPILASGITLNLQNITLSTGESQKLIATVTPDNVTNGSVIWTSENENVATVDSEGYVTAISVGTTKITASAADDSGVSAECTVIVSQLSEIDNIIADKSAFVKIFNLHGVLVYEGEYSEATLLPDCYIVVCDGKNIKVKIK